MSHGPWGCELLIPLYKTSVCASRAIPSVALERLYIVASGCFKRLRLHEGNQGKAERGDT